MARRYKLLRPLPFRYGRRIVKETIPYLVKDACNRNGLSQAQLAGLLSCDPSAVSKWVSGDMAPSSWRFHTLYLLHHDELEIKRYPNGGIAIIGGEDWLEEYFEEIGESAGELQSELFEEDEDEDEEDFNDEDDFDDDD